MGDTTSEIINGLTVALGATKENTQAIGDLLDGVNKMAVLIETILADQQLLEARVQMLESVDG